MTITIVAGQIPSVIKDPDSVLDYSVDWSPWLTERSDTITSIAVTASGVTVNSSAFQSGIVTVWLSGGVTGYGGYVTCEITTAGGRTDDRSFSLQIQNT